jgi:hypothetical protein
VADVSIDRQAIARMMGATQAEFDKYPVQVPLVADPGDESGRLIRGNTTNYYGPVINGDTNGAQLALG